ncbi:zinc finger protein, putative [Perkinsus marinus ATCC 50983]|uniref:RING-type E3 ubiquitin transferase n=1 Tax=Perkinsus marinus (strain ATCC 50983 / TXsc) TaxID=423536 RepID=C5LFE1_PERM5|nr:zinc finger protein, putative [Perkinsus marinus ATCC 50983]EER04573.1 zinc finger protein, putative [Perkinsus marinus ATCC 50983]|eukprot:XP_002772757.1 zinc finger protein, putative [Perkinsus marinus ATCC 50983]
MTLREIDIITILQIRFFLLQMQHGDNNNGHAKVSLLCIGVQALMDAYDSLIHLFLGLSAQFMFNTFSVVALFKFILFSMLEVRYLLLVWRSRRQNQFNEGGMDSIRRELGWLYSRFYGTLLVGMVILYNFYQYLNVLIIIMQCYWVPQIVYDIVRGHKRPLSWRFIVGISITRMIVPLYALACPYTIFNGEVYPALASAPNSTEATLIVCLQVAQIAIMWAQARFGPRSFVPWICLPHVYNYYRAVPSVQDEELGAPECVICMNDIDLSEVHDPESRPVITPCDHIFHAGCLEQWMDVKMECPTCRGELPAMT